MMQYPILNQITQTHNENYINQLFEELVSLNIKAMEEAKRRQSRQITWVPIKQLQEATGWGRTNWKNGEIKGNSNFNSLEKVESISIIWKMFNDSVGACKNKKSALRKAL